jgi:hypothetical protein
VVDRTQAPRAYAACLTSLAERRLQRRAEGRAEALTLAAWQRRPELVRRVHSILCGKQLLHPLAARVFVGVVGCGLLVASVQLARCPQVVAFVTEPRPHPVEIAQLQPVSAAAAYAPQASSGFRAIPAKVILPATALAPVTVGDAPLYDAPRQPQPAANSAVAYREAAGEPREPLIKATLPSASVATADQDSEPQYFVLTAWIETRISTLQAREITDYDTGAPERPQAGESATQITVTRLILAVYPVAAAPTWASGSQGPQSSEPVRPPAPPAASGWLVFEL